MGTTWRWCLACGYDPDGAVHQVRTAAIEARRRQGSWIPTVIVTVGLALGGAFLWRTTPSDGSSKATPTVGTPSWSRFSDPEGGFEVDVPGVPMASTGSVGAKALPTKNYVSVLGSAVFSVAEIDTGRPELDQGVSNQGATEVMRGVIGEVATASGGQVGDVTPIFVGAAPAAEYQIEGPLGDFYGRMVLVGRHVYNVSVAGKGADAESRRRFLESFKLD